MILTIISLFVIGVIVTLCIFSSVLYSILNFFASVKQKFDLWKDRFLRKRNEGKTRIHTEAPKKERIFSDKDGEYVDYEEIR